MFWKSWRPVMPPDLPELIFTYTEALLMYCGVA